VRDAVTPALVTATLLSTPWVAVAAPPAVAEVSPAPVRAAHPFVVGAEAGWNGLAGLGARASWNATPRLALEIGAGFVVAGPKAGARARWDFLDGAFTPYVALGGFASAGRAGAQSINDANDPFTFHVGPALYGQGVVGLETRDADRVTYGLEAGWAQDLTGRSLYVVSGHPTSKNWSEVRAIAGGGLVVAATVGYAF
jgi:hypothetical protein